MDAASLTERFQIVAEAPFNDGPDAALDIGGVEFGADHALLKRSGRSRARTDRRVSRFAAPTGLGEGGEAERWLPGVAAPFKAAGGGLYAQTAAAELDAGVDEATTVVEWPVGGLGWPPPLERPLLTAEYLREAEVEGRAPRPGARGAAFPSRIGQR